MANRAVVNLIIKGKNLAGTAFRGAGKKVKGLKDKVVSLNAAIAAIGVTATLAIGKKLVVAFGRQERAILRVSSALANMGKFSDENVKRLEENAAALQRITIHGDEAILEGTAAIAELANNLSIPELMQAQRAIIGIADTFFKGDIRSAATLTAKAIGSNVNALSRYGIELDTTASQQEKLNQLMKVAGPLFATSETAATDILGTMAQLGNAYGDVLESMGGVLVATLNLRDKNGELTNAMAGLATSITDNESKYIRWGRVTIAVVVAVGSTIKSMFSSFFSLGKILVQWIDRLEAKSELFMLRMANLIPGVVKDTTAAEEKVIDTSKALEDSFVSLGEQLLGTVDAWKKLGHEMSATDIESRRQAVTGNRITQAMKDRIVLLERLAELEAKGRTTPRSFLDGGFKATGPSAITGPSFTPSIPEQSAVEEIGLAMREAFEAGEGLNHLIAEMASDTMRGFADAVAEAFEAFADGSKSAGEAFASAMLGALASVARGFGQFYLAKATAAIGEGLSGNPAAFAAAAKFTAAAAALFALSGGLAAAAKGGSGSAAESTREARDLREMSQGTLNLELVGDFYLDADNTDAVDRFADMMSAATGRRVTVTRGG